MNNDQGYAPIEETDLKNQDYAPKDASTPMIMSPDEFCSGCRHLENLGHKGSDFLGLCRLGWPGVFSEETVTCEEFSETEQIEIRRCRIKIDLPGQVWQNRTIIITRSGELLGVLPETYDTQHVHFEG